MKNILNMEKQKTLDDVIELYNNDDVFDFDIIIKSLCRHLCIKYHQIR